MSDACEWDPVAPYYDYLFGDRTVDRAFWVGMAKQFGSPVLEISSGTGRLTYPIAEAGIRITGLDISGPMLRIARKKIGRYPVSVRKLVDFIQADALDFDLHGKKFSAVFMPWGFIPVTKSEQDGLFAGIRSVVMPGSHVVIDIQNSQRQMQDWNGVRLKEFVKLPRQGLTLLRQAYNSGSAATQIGHIIFTLDILRRNGSVKRVISERTYRVYTADELKSLMVAHGYTIECVYGDYDFTPWTPESPQAIVVARCSGGGLWDRIRDRVSYFVHK